MVRTGSTSYGGNGRYIGNKQKLQPTPADEMFQACSSTEGALVTKVYLKSPSLSSEHFSSQLTLQLELCMGSSQCHHVMCRS